MADYTVLEQQVKKNTMAIDRVTVFLFGNGEEGMDEQFRRVIKELSVVTTRLEEDRKRKLDIRDGIQIGSIVTLISTVIYLIVDKIP